MKEYKIGRDKLNRMFKELKDNGYLVEMNMIRENGKFKGKNYMIYDTPQNDVEEVSPMYRKPSTVKPSTGEPSTVNDTTTKNLSVQRTELNKKNTLKKEEISFFSVDECISLIDDGDVVPRNRVTTETANKLVSMGFNSDDKLISNLPF